MNKYVLRTSLVWIVVLAVIAGVWAIPFSSDEAANGNERCRCQGMCSL